MDLGGRADLGGHGRQGGPCEFRNPSTGMLSLRTRMHVCSNLLHAWLHVQSVAMWDQLATGALSPAVTVEPWRHLLIDAVVDRWC